MGLSHGKYIKLDENVRLSNVLLTMLHSVGAQEDSFGESTGDLNEVLAT